MKHDHPRSLVRLSVTAVAALAANRVIGKGLDMPWPKIKTDLRHFKRTTEGGVVIYGSKTLASFGSKALPNRLNLMMTRNPDAHPPVEGIIPVQDLHAAFERAAFEGYDEVYIVGGQEIFDLSLPYCDKLILTELARDAEGDRHFPKLSQHDWKEVAREPFVDDSGWNGDFVTYESTREKPIYCVPRNARNREYWADLIALNTLGECPFCEGGKTLLKQELLIENELWRVFLNAHPVDGARLQFLLVPKAEGGNHPTKLEELTGDYQQLLAEMCETLKGAFDFSEGVLSLREGKSVGCSVFHAHYQYTVVNEGETVQLYFGEWPLDAPLPLATDIAKPAGT